MLRWLIVGVLVLLTLIFGIKYLRHWLAWFNGQATEGSDETVAQTAPAELAVKRFIDIEDPFRAYRNSPNEIVRAMFHATTIWGREHRVDRREDETPDEYSRRLGRKYSEISESLTQLGLMYSRLAYAKTSVQLRDAQSLKTLWDWMRSNMNER